MADKSFGLKQINMIGVGTPTVESSTDLVINTNGSERVRIESGGNIGIGTDIARTELDVRGDVWINRSSANGQPAFFSNPTQLLIQHTSAPNVYLIRGEYRTSITSGDYLGQINFASNNNSSGQGTPVVAASIACDAQQSWTSSFNPGELIFRTNSGSSTSPSDSVGITSEGNIKFYRSGAGIDFSVKSNASGSTSELLDDYEEGTFTPTFTAGTVSGGYTRQVGEYTKVGRLVTFTLTIDGNGNLQGAAQALEIGGLPFTSRNVSEIGGAQVTYPGDFDTTNERRFWLVAQNNTTLSYRNSSSVNVNGNAVNNVNSQLNLCGYYFTDS